MIKSTGPLLTHGFSLIEVLVALAVLSTCAMLLFEGLSAGAHVWRDLRHEAQITEEVATAERFLRSRMGSIEPFQAPSAGAGPLPIIGTRDSLEFSAPMPAGVGAGSSRFQLRLRSAPGQSDLIVRWRRDWDGKVDRVAGGGWHEEVLLRSVMGLEFQYLSLEPTTGPVWRTDWVGRERIPLALRVVVRFPAEDRRRWPTLTVRPRIDADTLCDFDLVSRQCRGA